MKPYYKDAQVTIYHGDVREVLPSLTKHSFDVVIVDPPYGETELGWDRPIPGLYDLILPRLNPSGSMWIFGTMRSLMATIPELKEWRIAQDVIWEKHNGSGFAVDRFRRVHESIIHLYPKANKWADVHHYPQFTNDAIRSSVVRKSEPATFHGARGSSSAQYVDGGPRLMRSVIKIRSEHRRGGHPTQKPIGILTPLIEYSTPPGGLILDPSAGAGSVLRAAKNLDRRAIGIEIDERYCEVAAERMGQLVMSL